MSDLLDPDQLGRRWKKSRQSLAQMRYRGDGPKYIRVGRTILYRIQDVLDFEESQARTRTDEKPQGAA